MRITVDAAAAAGVSRLVLVSSVYSYGVPQTRKVGEDHPRMPETYKGRMRKEQEDITFEAQRKGQLPALVVRLPDFYGIHADNSLANPILRAALAGKTATWFGPVDAPHEFMFVSDAGTVIVELATRNDAYGEAWNFAGPGEITPREFMIKAYAVLGRQPKFRTLGRTMLKVAGWFKPEARELIEMLYLQERPVLLDDSKLQRLLGTVHKTSYEEGIHRTMDWMRAGGGAAG